MDVDVARLERFFLASAAKTYAGKEVPKTTIEGLPGSKVYRVEEGNLLYVDTYWTNGPYSGGLTLLFQDEINVWQMNYRGWCKDDNSGVLDFLKLVLGGTYMAGMFVGGRGFPEVWYRGKGKPGLVYQNEMKTELVCDFASFSGIEYIVYHPDDEQVFWHTYSGMLLAGDNDQGLEPLLSTEETERREVLVRVAQTEFQRQIEQELQLRTP